MPSLKNAMKQRILVDMLQGTGTPTWKVLLVDEHTLTLLSTALRTREVMEQKITIIENIAKTREPLPALEAVYFLTPTETSVRRFLSDFENKKKPMYAAAHIFFCSRLEDPLLNLIKMSHALPKIKTLKELFVDFFTMESQVFSFHTDNDLFRFFSPSATGLSVTLNTMAHQVVSLCATLGEYPYIRYMRSRETTRELASMSHKAIESFIKQNSTFRLRPERATLMIVDRTIDAIVPLLHDFFYQGMVFDLLNIKPEDPKFTFSMETQGGASTQKTALIDETDPLWPLLRHKHIRDAIEWIQNSFQSFVSSNSIVKVKGSDSTSLRDMSDAIRSMPQYQETLGKYSLHLELTQSVMRVFTDTKLDRVGELEQDFATGYDDEGKPLKNPLAILTTVLNDPLIPKQDKLRLVLIFIIGQGGLKEEHRKSLMDLAAFSHGEQNTLRNLAFLGVKVSQARDEGKKKPEKKKKSSSGEEDVPFARYVPAMKTLITNALQNTLEKTEFPYVKEPPPPIDVDDEEVAPDPKAPAGSSKPKATPVSLRKPEPKPEWLKKLRAERLFGEKSPAASSTAAPTEEEYKGPRLIIFVLGGVTFAETRMAYELSKAMKREVIIGGSSILLQNRFLSSLETLQKMEAV